MYPATKNIVLGAGHIYFDEYDANGNLTGERYLAETPGFSIAIASQSVPDYSSDGPTAELHMDAGTRVDRTANLSLKDINADNLAMFLIGDKTTISTTSGPVTADPINGGNGVKQGRWYQLGVDSTQPAGVRNISALAIKDGVPTTYTLDTDHKEDLVNGRIYIIPGGGIADGTVITADYTEATTSWEQVSSNNLGPKTGALRYVAANTSGENRDAFLPDVVMKPAGSFGWKSRDTVQQMDFEVAIKDPSDDREAIYINGRAA